MGRSSLDREWTEPERELAERICDAVALGEGRIVAALSIVRAVGMKFGKEHKDQSLNKIYDVMPLAVMISVYRYPGKVLLQNPKYHTYTMSTDQLEAKLVITNRLKKMTTMASRMDAEAKVLESASDLGSIMARKMLAQTRSGLDPIVWNAIMAEAETGGRAE